MRYRLTREIMNDHDRDPTWIDWPATLGYDAPQPAPPDSEMTTLYEPIHKWPDDWERRTDYAFWALMIGLRFMKWRAWRTALPASENNVG
jgi:hypothetical protein